MRAQMGRHAQALSTPDLLRCIRAFNHAANDARASWQPSLPLELAFIESCQPPVEIPTTNQAIPASVTQTVEKKTAPHPARQAKETTPPSASKQETPALTPEESQSLDQHWSQVLNLVRKSNPNAYGLLNSCRSRHLSGKVLVLGFASDVLKNQMAKKENVILVQQALEQVLGAPVTVRCVINTAKRTTIPTEVDDDGMVAAALRDLGGEIVDIQ
jgi:DNA polymerase III gamma/tau subunit